MSLLFTDAEALASWHRKRETVRVFGSSYYNAQSRFSPSDMGLLAHYIATLRKREIKRNTISEVAPQIKYRRELLNIVMCISSEEALDIQTVYLAIYLLDRFMSTNSIPTSHLPVVAIVCLVVSGKLNEVYPDIPKYAKLTGFVEGPQARVHKLALTYEGLLLSYFKFDLLIPSEASFLEVFLLYAVDGLFAWTLFQEEDEANNNNNNVEQLMVNGNYPEAEPAIVLNYVAPPLEQMQLYSASQVPNGQLIHEISETAFLILQELTRATVPSSTFSPSLIAASILMASRREHNLNFWTENLRNITSFNIEQLQDCLGSYVEPNIEKAQLTKPYASVKFMDVGGIRFSAHKFFRK